MDLYVENVDFPYSYELSYVRHYQRVKRHQKNLHRKQVGSAKMVTTCRPQKKNTAPRDKKLSNKTPIAAPADHRHGRYLHVPITHIFLNNVAAGKNHAPPLLSSFLLGHWLSGILWKSAHGLTFCHQFVSHQWTMPEIPTASSVSCHDGRNDSSTCRLKFSWNPMNIY